MADTTATGKITPIVLVHAITASGLHDEYPPDQERVWSPVEMVFREYDRMALYPDTGVPEGRLRYEAREPALVRPSEMFGVVYKDLISELKHNLSFGPTPVQPVYPFVYDWRQDNARTIVQLRAFVNEVIGRTNLMRHDPAKTGKPVCDCVDLIGHSMGGLVVAGCIAANADGWSRKFVRRVVTLGTPFRGANAAIAKIATGGGPLFGRDGRERERTVARVTPAVYQLLPSFEGALDGLPPEAIWDPATYQSSIHRSIAEFIGEVHADVRLTKATEAAKAKREALGEELLREMLEAARKFRALTDSVRPDMIRPAPEGGWLAIVGAGETTLIRTGLAPDTGNPGKKRFNFDDPTFTCPDSWNGKTLETGDETVPLRGAIPPWDEPWRSTVVVTRGDFAFLGELGDRFLTGQLGLHSVLPLLNLAQRWIINLFRPEWSTDAALGQHGKLWGRRLPGFPANQSEKNVWKALVPGLRLSDVP